MALFQDTVISVDRTLVTGSAIKGYEADIVAVACFIQPPRGCAAQNDVGIPRSLFGRSSPEDLHGRRNRWPFHAPTFGPEIIVIIGKKLS